MFRIALLAKGRADEREQQGRAWLAWHTAALPRMKTFPKLEGLMGIKREVKRQANAEIDAIFRAMAGVTT